MDDSTHRLEVERRINEHLEGIDRALAAKGVPFVERRSITDDLEAQIRDMLAESAGGAPTAADVDAVLGRLDPPESYGEGREGGPLRTPPAMVPTVAPEPQYREFRRRVLSGALGVCVLGLPIGIALHLPVVWGLSLIGMVVASIKLAADRP